MLVGRTVTFINEDGKEFAAVVTHVHNEKLVNLAVCNPSSDEVLWVAHNTVGPVEFNENGLDKAGYREF